MQRYIIRRVLQGILILLILTVVVFFMVRATGDPTALYVSELHTEEDIRLVRERLGLDKPIPEQYIIFVGNLVKGDLGNSIRGLREPVVDKIARRLGPSLELAAFGVGISMLMGLALGVISAVKRESLLDTGGRALSLIGQAVPTFWLGLVLMWVFGYRYRILPTSGYGGIAYFILPGITMGLYSVAAITRLTRASMIEVLDSEYIKLLRVKGLSEKIVILKHALKNSLIPVVSFMSPFIIIMITGSVVVETIFNWPGIGRLLFESVLARDFPVVQGLIMSIAFLFMLSSLIADIIYAYLDPRIRYTR